MDDALEWLFELESELSLDTEAWTVPEIAYTFPIGERGEEDLADHVEILGSHGYTLVERETTNSGFDLLATFELDDETLGKRSILVREYRGTSQEEATRAFRVDATHLARYGYRVASQSWDPGTRGVAGVLMLGLFSPKHGTLTVTYELARSASASAPQPEVSVADELQKLAALREAGVLSPEEFDAEKRRLLTR